MQNLFINPEEEFVIRFSVATDKYNTIFCDLTKESLIESLKHMGKEISDFTIEEYKAVFRKPSFGDSMDLYNDIFNVNDKFGVTFNPIVARYNKIMALIKSWNLKGKEEKPSEEDVRQLHPVIANAIGIQIDLETGGVLS
jgi:hypothetical protein